MIFSFFRRRENAATGDLYAAIVAQARHEHFYLHLGVPDTVDGRFDMIALHAILLFNRMKGAGETAKTRAQAVFDRLFREMDRALREMGVSDTSVPRKVKRMAELFYGSADAYMSALNESDDAALTAALTRNVYAGASGRAAEVAALARYVRASAEALQAQDGETLAAGTLAWIDPAPFVVDPHTEQEA